MLAVQLYEQLVTANYVAVNCCAVRVETRQERRRVTVLDAHVFQGGVTAITTQAGGKHKTPLPLWSNLLYTKPHHFSDMCTLLGYCGI